MRKTIIRFFTIADFEEEEIWLREKHNSGWKLVKLTPPCFYTFESCEPQDVIYRLDFKNDTQDEEYMQMLADFGWEYFEHCLGGLYFRKPADSVTAENEGELFSDRESKAEMVSNIIRTRMLPIMLIFLCCVIPNLRNAFRGNMGVLSGVFSAIFGILFIIYVYIILHCSTKLKRLRDEFKD